MFPYIETTKEVLIPENPLERVIGQDKAIERAKLAVKQRRHLLLVGPPGIGKSMLAKSMAYHLLKPREQISICHNPKNPNRPIVEIVTADEINNEKKAIEIAQGRIADPVDVPTYVAEELGFRCSNCGFLSNFSVICQRCGANKQSKIKSRRLSLFGDVITEVFEIGHRDLESEVKTTYIDKGGVEKTIIYQRIGNNKIRVLNEDSINAARELKDKGLRNIIVPLKRNNFIHATGASETELLGDVRHDPYGSHPEIGTPAYLRVVPGAIHEAHEGILFIDELPQLENLQNFILTAMQEKKFSIVGRNPQSAGASVKVNNVPCDFLFVGACNIREVSTILPPLRSRILGNGYEVLLNTVMPDTEENRKKLVQFVAQEIQLDGRIPHATKDAVIEIINEAEKRARIIDDARNSLTLRLRDIGGILRMGGDFAVFEGAEFIEKKHIKKSINESKPIEYQLQERYGSLWKGLEKDSGTNLNQDRIDGSYL